MGKKRLSQSLVFYSYILVLAALMVFSFSMLAGNQETKMGEKQYRDLCAKCHGEDGEGYGPISESLESGPADLTYLSINNGGPFPKERVVDVLTGRVEVREHGTSDMPVWGDVFKIVDEEGGEELVRKKIDTVVHYLVSIQVNQEKEPKEQDEELRIECQPWEELYFDYIKRYSEKEKREILNDSQAMTSVVKCWMLFMGFTVERVAEGGKKEFFDAAVIGYHEDDSVPEFRESFEVGKGLETKRGQIRTRLTLYKGRVVLLYNKSDLENFGTKPLKFRPIYDEDWVEILKH